MLAALNNILVWKPFIPHGHCYLWKPGLVGLHLTSDLLIALAYYSISITLIYFVHKREDVPFTWIFLLFGGFIVACGTTHLIEILTLWYPVYWLSGYLKIFTAFVSVVTAIELIPLVPKLLRLPSPAQLEIANQTLAREISDRIHAEAALQQAHDELENRVRKRTAELALTNEELKAEINHRQQSENALRESQQRLVLALEAGQLGTWEYELSTQKVIGSTQCEALFGLEPGSFEGTYTALIQLIHPDDLDLVKRSLQAAIQESSKWEMDYRVVYPDGSIQWIASAGKFLYSHTGQAVRMLGVARNISDRKQSEQLLANYNHTLEKQVAERTAQLSQANLRLTQEISERQEVETALRHSEAKLSAILDNVGAYIYIKDLNGRFIYVNHLCSELFNVPETEIIGSEEAQFLPEQMALKVRESDRQVIESGTVVRFYEVGHFQTQGECHYYLTSKVPLKHPDGTIYAICGISTDITDLKQAEAAQAQSKERLTLALEAARMDIWDWNILTNEVIYSDPRGPIFSCPQLRQIESYSSFLDFVHPEDLGYVTQAVTKALEGATYDIEFRVVWEDGTTHWLANKGQVYYNELGAPVRMIGVAMDITERKHIEKLLQESQEKYKTLFEIFPIGISITDEQGNLIESNPASEKILEISSFEHNNRKYDAPVWISIRPDGSPMPAEEFASVRALTENRVVESVETGMVKPNGEVSWISVTAAPIPLAGYGVAIAYIDITQRKQAEEELRWKETLLRSMADASPLAFYVVDNRSDAILYFNHRFCEIWGIEHLEEQMQCGQLKNNEIIPDCLPRLVDISGFAESFQPLQSEENRITIEDEIAFRSGQIVRRFSSQIRDESDRYFGRLYLFEDVSDRKQAEAALRESEARFQAFMDYSPTAAWITDKDGHILYTSQSYDRLFQFLNNHGVGKKHIGLFPPEFSQQYLKNTRSVIETNQALEVIEQAPRPDGTIGEFLVYKFPLPSLSGEQVVGGIAIDITERQKAEVALQRREQEFRALVENAPDIIMRLDREYRYLYISPSIEKHKGIPASAWIGKTIENLEISESLVQLWQTTTRQVFETHQEQVIEFEAPSVSGLAYYTARLVPEFSSDGSVQSVLAIARDISDRKQVEETLRQSEARMQALLTAMPDLMIRQHIDGTYLDVAGNENNLLIPRQALIGSNFNNLPIPEAVKVDLLERFHAATTTGKLQIYEHDLQKPDGTYTYETRIIKSGIDEVVCIVRDVTERKRFLLALQESEARYFGILEDQTDVIIRFLPDSTITFANEAFCRYFGLSHREIIGYSYRPLIFETDRDYVDFLLMKININSPVITIENRMIAKGQVRWMQWINRAIFDSCDRLIEYQSVGRDITDRKQWEAALWESESTLRSFFNSSLMLMGIVELYDDDIFHLSDNQATAQFFGTTPEQMKNRFASELGVPRSHLKLWLSYYREAEKSQSPVRFEYRHETPAGIKWLSACVCPIAVGSNGCPRFSYIVEDISDRKRVEESLRKSEGRLRLAMEAAKLGTWEYDLVSGEIFESDRLQEIYGLELNQMHETLEHWSARIHPDDRDRVSEEFNRALQGDIEYNTEFRYQRPDGTMRWLNSMGIFIRDRTGQALHVYGVAGDISDRKQAEAEIKSQQEFLRQVIDVVPSSIFVKDTEGRLLMANKISAQMHVTETEEMFDKPQDEFNPNFYSDPVDEYITTNQEVMRTRQPQTLTQKILNAQGECRWYKTVISPFIDSENRVMGIIGSATDITELKETEAQLRQAKDAAEAANRAKSRFLSNMSHELRTPLNAILGFSQVMARHHSFSQEQKEQLNIINRSGEHLLDLINDILSMSKIEAGQVTLNENCFDLYQLLDELEQMFRFKAKTQNLQMIFQRAVDLPQHVQTDEGKLRQVLMNLLGNAIKFTKTGGITLRVNQFYDNNDPMPGLHLQFEIEDTGPGIAPGEIHTLFDPFTQTETGRQSMQGTGLGLPISCQFVRLMGGEMLVKSKVDEGTMFTFDIQVKPGIAPAQKTLLTTKQVIRLEPNQPAYRILIVEDMEENRKLLARLLKSIGFQVREAINGEQAVALWSTWQPHLIWMDMRMPVMDGYEATRQIKAKERQKKAEKYRQDGLKTVIIALTASAFNEDRAQILAAGCDDFIGKPFRISTLFDKMAQYLGVRYIYKEDNQFSSSQETAIPKPLSVKELGVMPSEWITQLHEAVLCANDQLILKLIQQIPHTESYLANALTDLVNNFRLDIMLELTQALIEE